MTQVDEEISAARDREKHLAKEIFKLEKELMACRTLITELKETAHNTTLQLERLEKTFAEKA